MTTTLPQTLPHLTPAEEVLDAMYRILNGIDSNDLALFKSGFTNDAVFDATGTPVQEGLETIIARTFGLIGPLTTMHLLSNPRVFIESSTSAQVTATALSQHFPAGEGLAGLAGVGNGMGRYFLAGSNYHVQLVKGDDGWKVKHWVLKREWAQGDPSLFASAKSTEDQKL